MPIEAPGPVIDVIKPTLISAAPAGSASSEAIVTPPTERRNLFTNASQLAADAGRSAPSASACGPIFLGL
jgi:hypothetical protein